MTREEIIRLAREAFGAPYSSYLEKRNWDINDKQVERFAALVAAAERDLITAWVEDMCEGLDAKTIANGIRNGGNDDMRAFEVKK